MSNCIILGYSVTIGLPEIVIFLLAAILLGFSIHFYWAGKRSVPGLKQPTPMDDTHFSEDDQWRLQFYEQIEKHEKTQENLEKELKRMAEAEKILLNELEQTREEVARLEKIAEKASVSVSGESAPTRNTISDLVMAQQNLHESLSREMTERLERAYEEFNFLQDRIQKIESQVIDPQQRSFETSELEQSYFRITKEYDELKLKQLTLMEENQRLTRALADAEEKLRDANFLKQQLARKVSFLEELTQDLQQLSGHHKKLEGQLKRISEIEALLARKS
jgi:DNA repair exonuclease SbcCD ATPase subunit